MAESSDIVVRQTKPDDAILDLRWRVLEDGVGSPPTELTDTDKNPDVIHVAAYIGDNPVSTARLEPTSEEGMTYYVRKMATDPE